MLVPVAATHGPAAGQGRARRLRLGSATSCAVTAPRSWPMGGRAGTAAAATLGRRPATPARMLGMPRRGGRRAVLLARVVSDEDFAAPGMSAEELGVGEIQDRMRKALLIDPDLRDEIVISGTGTHLGMDVEWQLRTRPDGAFVEELVGEHLNYCWGCDGGQGGNSVWEVDFTGLPQQLELDDRESSLLCTWVRSGHWLLPAAQEMLDVDVERDGPASGGAGGGGGGEVVLGITLRGGRVRARLCVDAQTWEPQHMLLPVCGDMERWGYRTWGEVDRGVSFPLETEHSAAAGGKHTFITRRARRVPPGFPTDALLYAMPASPPVPADTSFDDGVSSTVPVVRTRSGHVLVRPKVDGREIGLFILDTGASGFVITPEAAKDLGLDAFGELWVSGVGGKVRCQFRRAREIELGALRMARPLFMEMALTGVVVGTTEPVVGIVGYDIFRRTVVEVPPFRPGGGAGAGPSAEAGELQLHNPERYGPEYGQVGLEWQELFLVANVPHVRASFVGRGPGAAASDGGGAGRREHNELFMLDSGAGGVECMFHARAVEALGLLAEEEKRKFARVRGVGGEQNTGIKVTRGTLPSLQLAGNRFERVSALFATCGGLDLSLHTCGMLCGDLLAGCHVVYDYSRKRVAFAKDPSSSKP